MPFMKVLKIDCKESTSHAPLQTFLRKVKVFLSKETVHCGTFDAARRLKC